MKKKSTSQSGFLGPRALIAFLFCAAAAYSVLTGASLAFFRPDVPATASRTPLTFAERVAHQRAIEEVYWRHRIWPNERPDAKPSLDEVIPSSQLEKKVEDYLRNSEALDDYWHQPIAPEQLQAEMDRIAHHTKQPEVLREIFAALGNNPAVIAECLARPALAERLARELHVRDLRGDVRRTKSATSGPSTMSAIAAMTYTLPVVTSARTICFDNWTATGDPGPAGVAARYGHTAVWTGSEMIVWRGGLFGYYPPEGGRYNPTTDSWTATSPSNEPLGDTAAVWTGTEMIVWGGQIPEGQYTNTGGRYNPATDSWIATSTTNAPEARVGHTTVWTGSEMIVWGGATTLEHVNSGGRYNPSTDSWTATSFPWVPCGQDLCPLEARDGHTTVWTGTEMIVWGGDDGSTPLLNTGGKYNPSTDGWSGTDSTTAPTARISHTAVWTGTEMIVWGGNDYGGLTNAGGRYNPSTDSWTPTSITNAPDARVSHTSVWTGNEMIVWGGHSSDPSGGRYDPITDSWVATSTANAPTARWGHTAVWTGSEMIVWGGLDGRHGFDTGGRYCGQSGPTPTPTPSPTATATPTPTPTPTVNISGTISYCSNPVPGPVPNVTLTLTGSGSGSTLSDGSGNYTFSSLASGGNYTVTPTKAARTPGSAGINTADVIATQRHFLNLTLLTGCRLTAADVNGDTAVNTSDLVAVQRFFLGFTTGIANVGKYQFNPTSRSYSPLTSDQTGQNYDALVFGDVASAFVE